MRVLFLSPREAWPPNSGAKLRDYYLARGLARAAEVHYLFFGGRAAAGELKAVLGSAQSVTPPPKYTAGKILKGLAGSPPLPILNYSSAEMGNAIASLAGIPFDVVHLDSIHMAGYLALIRRHWLKATITLDWHNIESEAMDRFAANTSSLARRWYARYTAGQLRTVEDEMLATLDGHVVCSQRECELLMQRNARARIALVENGVDTSSFRPFNGAVTERLIFVGQMSYAPNVEAVVWFFKEIWPVLREHMQALSLSIVGADPGPTVRALGSHAGINVTGTVPDVRSYYEGALAAIVPLRSGAGTRLKILEAMAAGVPVISTSLGAEGLEVEDKIHLLIADDVPAWTDALEWVADEARRRALTTAARELVVRRYDWEFLGQKLVETYTNWCTLRL